MTAADVLGRRALGRATLARQLLLDRAPMPVQLLVRYLAAFGLATVVAPGCDPDVVLTPQRRRSAGSVRDGGS